MALVLNGLDPHSRHATLYFLDEHRSRLVAEDRKLLLMGSVEERAQKLLEELLLSPYKHTLQPLFTQDARLGAVLHRGNRLYVDIELPDVAAQGLSFGLVRSAIEKTISASIPGAGELVLFVNGTRVAP